MTRGQALVGAGVVVVVLAYAGLAGAWTSRDPGWYAALPKPTWQPPDLVFGIIWPYNFLALLVAGMVLTGTRPTRTAAGWLAVLAVTAVFALAWAYLFYVPHALAAAAVCLGGSAVAAWLLVVLAGREIGWLTVLLLPYAVWVSVATALAVSYSRA